MTPGSTRPKETGSAPQAKALPQGAGQAGEPVGRRRPRRRDRRDPEAPRHHLTAAESPRDRAGQRRAGRWTWSGRARRPSGAGRLREHRRPGRARARPTLAEEIAALTRPPVVHMDDLFEGWDGLPRDRRPARRAAAAARRGPARELPPLGLARGPLGGDRDRAARSAARPGGRRLGLAGPRRPDHACWSGSRCRTTSRMARGSARGGVEVPSWQQWAVDEQDAVRRGRGRGSGPTSASTAREVAAPARPLDVMK